MVGIFLLIYCKDMIKEPKRIYYLVFAGLATLLLSAYYIYPFLEQLLSDIFYFKTYKTVPYNVCGNRIDYVEVLKSMTDGLIKRSVGPKLGLLLMAPLCFRFFVRKGADNKQKTRLRSVDIGVIIGLVCVFLVSNFGPWDKFPLTYLSVIQFPCRLYEFVSFFFAVAGGYYLHLVCKTSSVKIITVGVVSVLTSVSIVVSASEYHDRNQYSGWSEARKVLNEENQYIKAGMEYFPTSMPYPDPFIPNRKDSVISQTGETAVSDFVRNKYITEFNINTNAKDSLELPLIYYKGYSVTLNGNELPVGESRHGLVQIQVDQSGRVEAWYKGTLIQKLSFYTTILSIFVLCVYVYLQRKKKKQINN